jgi:2,3-bisphosphoglycerate-independent phosphoglycerate mutase
LDDIQSVIYFNFRSDRAIQLTEAFVSDEFEGFQREKLPLFFATMIQYDPDYPVKILFEPQKVYDCLSKIVSDNGFKVLKVAETEKYAHVTYFFNGGVEEAFPNEERILIPSRNESFDKIPEMQAVDITQKLIEAMRAQQHHLIVTNYANPDMVGHTGNLQSAVKSLEIVDQSLGPLIATALDNGYNVILSADHGNCDEMIDLYKGEPTTTHTDNPVFFIDVDPLKRLGDFVLSKEEIIYTLSRKQPDNFLIDIAPLALNYMNLSPATEMTGIVSATLSSDLSRNI